MTPDLYGIVTEHASRRATFGNRRSHGKVCATIWRPVVVAPGPLKPPPARIRAVLHTPATTAAPASAMATPAPAAVIASKAQTAPAVPPRSISVGDVLRAVSEAWGVSREDILSKRIGRREVWPRLAAYLLLRNHTGMSLPAIGRALCRKDHTSAMSGIRKAIALREGRAEFRERFERAEAGLKGER